MMKDEMCADDRCWENTNRQARSEQFYWLSDSTKAGIV
jgi:hypothetical protein